MTRDKLISRIEAFALAHEIAPATVTSRAVGNSRLYRRLKDGRGCTLDVAERLTGWMDAREQSAAIGSALSVRQTGT